MAPISNHINTSSSPSLSSNQHLNNSTELHQNQHITSAVIERNTEINEWKSTTYDEINEKNDTGNDEKPVKNDNVGQNGNEESVSNCQSHPQETPDTKETISSEMAQENISEIFENIGLDDHGENEPNLSMEEENKNLPLPPDELLDESEDHEDSGEYNMGIAPDTGDGPGQDQNGGRCDADDDNNRNNNSNSISPRGSPVQSSIINGCSPDSGLVDITKEQNNSLSSSSSEEAGARGEKMLGNEDGSFNGKVVADSKPYSSKVFSAVPSKHTDVRNEMMQELKGKLANSASNGDVECEDGQNNGQKQQQLKQGAEANNDEITGDGPKEQQSKQDTQTNNDESKSAEGPAKSEGVNDVGSNDGNDPERTGSQIRRQKEIRKRPGSSIRRNLETQGSIKYRDGFV